MNKPILSKKRAKQTLESEVEAGEEYIETHLYSKIIKPIKTKKKEKNWIKEFKWISKTDFNKELKGWFEEKKEFSPEWQSGRWLIKYTSSTAIENSLKQDLRNVFLKEYLQGRNWRARNIKTEEIVKFPDILNYYNK